MEENHVQSCTLADEKIPVFVKRDVFFYSPMETDTTSFWHKVEIYIYSMLLVNHLYFIS